MKIGIISDTHDDHNSIGKAVDIFNERRVSYILHAGDIVAPFSARAFEKCTEAKFIAVFGNNDGEKLYLTSIVNGFGGKIHEYCYKGTLQGKSIYMTHTHHNIDEIIASGMYDMVIYGHTHQQDIRRHGKTLVINPGESTDWLTGSGHIVIVELDDMSYESISL